MNVYRIKFADGYEYHSIGFPDDTTLDHEILRHGAVREIKCEGKA